MPTIEVQHVDVEVPIPAQTFRDMGSQPATRKLLSDITLTLDEHRIGIIGANGSGKSTFARLLNGLQLPTRGQVCINGRDVASNLKTVRNQVGFIFSDADSQILMPTVVEDVQFSLRKRKLGRTAARNKALETLERFGIAHLADASPHVLSGGEKQLLALASVVVMEPEIVVADEPTTMLDLANRMRVTQALFSLEQQVIIISHDLEVLQDVDRVVCFDHARISGDSAQQRANNANPVSHVIAEYRERILRSVHTQSERPSRSE